MEKGIYKVKLLKRQEREFRRDINAHNQASRSEGREELVIHGIPEYMAFLERENTGLFIWAEKQKSSYSPLRGSVGYSFGKPLSEVTNEDLAEADLNMKQMTKVEGLEKFVLED